MLWVRGGPYYETARSLLTMWCHKSLASRHTQDKLPLWPLKWPKQSSYFMSDWVNQLRHTGCDTTTGSYGKMCIPQLVSSGSWRFQPAGEYSFFPQDRWLPTASGSLCGLFCSLDPTVSPWLSHVQNSRQVNFTWVAVTWLVVMFLQNLRKALGDQKSPSGSR